MQFDEHSICRPRCYLLPQIHSLCALSIVYDSWKKIHLKDNPKGKKRDLTFGFILCIVSFLFLFICYIFLQNIFLSSCFSFHDGKESTNRYFSPKGNFNQGSFILNFLFIV